jgi:hypothetical protein
VTAAGRAPEQTAELRRRLLEEWGTVIGGALVCGIAWLLPLGGSGAAWWASRFLLLAALVWVPLALRLVDHSDRGFVSGLATLARRAQPWGALALVGAFVAGPDPLAALLVLPWLAITGLVGLLGLARLLGRRRLDAPRLCMDLGMLALPTGGMWLLASRAGIPLFGFGEPITLLTGVHFHYAGFLGPVLIGLTGGYLPESASPARRVFFVLGPAVCLGPWGVAIGITIGGHVEALAGLLFAGLLSALALVLLRWAVPSLPDRGVRLLLAFAYGAAVLGMAFAAAYAAGRVRGGGPGLAAMAGMHGSLQALGFVGCGLLAYARLLATSQLKSSAPPATA